MKKTIRASVGRFGINRKVDVEVIQQLLNQVPMEEGGPVLPIPETGYCGERMKAAIGQFQGQQLGPDEVDGRVDPGSRVLERLLSFEGRQESQPRRPGTVQREYCIRSVDNFYEVKQAGATAGSIYWLGVRPMPASLPRKFAGRPQLVRMAAEPAAGFECPATYTTVSIQGELTSELTLRFATGVVQVPMKTHLLGPVRAGRAVLAGFFRRVG